MKIILVPIDFSDYSKNAASYAISFANQLAEDVKIVLLHAYHIPVVDPFIPQEYLTELGKTAENDALKKVEELQKELQEQGVKDHIQIEKHVTMGFAVDEIKALEKTLGTDLIVMGTRHTDRFQRVLLGSVTGATIEKVRTPIIVVPGDIEEHREISRVVYTAEFEDMNTVKALREILKFTTLVNAELMVVHASTKQDENDETRLQALRDEFSDMIENNYISFTHVTADHIIDGLLDFVNKTDADLTVMITHKHSFFMRLFSRSTTKDFVYKADAPVLIFHDEVLDLS